MSENKDILVSGKVGGNIKSSYARKVEKDSPQQGDFKSRNRHSYQSEGRDTFVIAPMPNEDGKVVTTDLSFQAQEFLSSGKNRIQINNQVDDVLHINTVPDEEINYKNIPLIKKYISQFGQIKSMYGLWARVKSKKRRLISNAIKKARFLGLISYPDQII